MTEINAACIIAHPDDETIWMGGTILQKNKWKWAIISLCRANDKDRAPKFERACKIYRAKSVISDLDDEVLQPLELTTVEKKILSVLPEKKYNYIFTHGKTGEYGHLRHKEIHGAVKSLVRRKKILCKKLLFFSYEKGARKFSIPSEKSDIFTFLSSIEYKNKISIITKIYGFSKESFESRSCSKKEAFVESR